MALGTAACAGVPNVSAAATPATIPVMMRLFMCAELPVGGDDRRGLAHPGALVGQIAWGQAARPFDRPDAECATARCGQAVQMDRSPRSLGRQDI
ncbi:hypothetical protein GCM10009616_08970 [Microlunatus lacustris]